jgi:nicotinamidase-related amidase
MRAVVFVDVQKDFIDGALRNEKAIEVTPKIVELAKDYISRGYKLYATRDTHEKTIYDNCTVPKAAFNPELPLAGYMTTLEGQKLPVEHCVEGTDGWMIDERLMDVIYGNCTFINKPTFGSFDLAEIIAEDFKDSLPEEIIICGFVTSICVLANAVILRAKFPNTKITVLKDLCAGITKKDHDAALEVLKMQQIDVN